MVPSGSHRQSVIGLAVALTIGITGLATGGAHAADPQVTRLEIAATALRPAIRLAQSGSIIFPMNPLPRCEVAKSSFGQPRSGGRIHEGIDIMADKGQEVYAVGNGKLIKQTIDGATDATLAGNSWTLQLPDGTYYFYAHLSAFASGLKVNDSVALGQLIGYVGDTGNPGPGNYHLHFEVHPKGGAAVDPFPLLTIPKSCRIFTT
ncbi:MAG TPA: M23 family metallopeptidase [Ilumatobacteraceae bacterium]|nr:M23 family metallopeptidase [Ilumatobacteraceae bacterium]